MSEQPLRIGIAGLGGAGAKVLPLLAGMQAQGLHIGAAADLRAEARQAFSAHYRRPAYGSVAALCQDADIDLIYVATPSQYHCEHSLAAIAQGKHVVCEKPLATQLRDCDRMINAARQAGVLLLQGHSKVLDAPVQAMRKILQSGTIGKPFQIDCWNCNDWMRRPRLADELNTHLGGGVVLRQGPQLIDLVRILMGETPLAVRASTGQHAPGLPTEGNFSALLSFTGGTAATISFNGYGHLTLGRLLAPHVTTKPRQTRRQAVSSNEKYAAPSPAMGAKRVTDELVLVSATGGTLVASSQGVQLFRDGVAESVEIPRNAGRASGFLEVRDALQAKRPGFPDGHWAKTTLEICLAILESSRCGQEVRLQSIASQTEIPT